MTRPMTGQPETVDELAAANKRANRNEYRAREQAGITRTDVMNVVEEVSALDAVGLAWGETLGVGVSTASDVSTGELRAALEADGYPVAEYEEYDADAGYLYIPLTDGESGEEA